MEREPSEPAADQPVPGPQGPVDLALVLVRAARPIARVRVPLTLAVAPVATGYRLEDGRTLWCLRLPVDGEVRSRCVPTDRLRRYARESGLRGLAEALEAALAGAAGEAEPDGR